MKELALRLVEAFGVDPLVRKESYGLSRRWQTYVARAAYVGVLALIVWIVWFNVRERGVVDYSSYARMGEGLFITFSGLQFGLVALGAVGAGSDMISREVREKTLGVLAITPLGPWRIVLGKWKFAVGYNTMVILSGIPVLALGIFLGGVAGDQLVRVSALTFSMTMSCAAFGLLCSSIVRGSPTLGRVLGVLGMGLWLLAPLLLGALLYQWDRQWRDEVFAAACWVQPTYAIIAELGGRTASVSPHLWIGASLSSVAMTALCLWLAALRVASMTRADPVPRGRLFPEDGIGPAVEGGARPVWDFNPYLWKEMRARLTGRLPLFVGSLVALLVAFGVILGLIGENLKNEGTAAVVYVILLVLLFLLSVSSGASSFTREKEEKSWEILRTTPMTAGRVLAAKLAGAAVGVTHWVVLLLVFTVVTLVATERANPVPLVVASLLFTVFTLSVGMVFSLHVESTRKAYSFTLGVVFLLLLGICLMVVLLQVATQSFDRDAGRVFLAIMRATNPFLHIEPLVERRTEDGYVAGFLVYCVLYAGLTWGALALCRAQLRALIGAER